MKREFKSYLLLVICVLTQVVAVFPHHHHADNLCLQSDWEVLCAVHGEKDSCPHDVPAENALTIAVGAVALPTFSLLLPIIIRRMSVPIILFIRYYIHF